MKIKIPEIQISLRYKGKKAERFKITDSKSVATLARTVFDADTIEWHETMFAIYLNRANEVLGFFKIASGGTNCVLCDPKLVFTAALNCGANSLILTHNHPSGNAFPSESDKAITKQIKAGAELLDMHLLDHVIVTKESYYSFADRLHV
jgi:DNA repair protein RadC